jgi:hypothetical protein
MLIVVIKPNGINNNPTIVISANIQVLPFAIPSL